ncbi:MAG: UPF0262 family protein [Emcibacteraceae bacterium]|nr:UPF0262 family protein [Emcibacteraceae bacterium]MDG1858032.1 UPF0262 family protein [Emcibacteraceae bacterium]
MIENSRLNRICEIELDEKSIIRRSENIEHERRVAIFDLLETNHFSPKIPLPNDYPGPFHVTLRMEDNRLAIELKTQDKQELSKIVVPLSPLRSVIKEYFIICDSYYSAIKTAPPRQLEAIDLGRKSLHNEGSQILKDRYSDKIDIDFETARRLFTLICVLQIRQ